MAVTATGAVQKHLGTIKGLREFCTVHRESILVRRLAPPADVAAWWPGGAKNPRRDLAAWIRCFANYVAFLDRDGPEREAQNRAAKQQAILDTLADTPEDVPLVARDEKGERRFLTVYPKNYVALVEVHNRNLRLAEITDEINEIQANGRPSDVDLLVRAYEAQCYLQRVIVWIATTPGLGLPFIERAREPEPPAEYSDLHPADLYALSAAFQRVNVFRLQSLDVTRRSESRPDWSVFFASLADSLKRSTAEVMRDMSLASALAASAERARAHAEAAEAAKAKIPARQGRKVS